MSDIHQLKRQLDIVDVVGAAVRLKSTGSNYLGFCPFHDNKKTPSFTVSQSKQFYHCFSCGANGDVLDFVQNYYGYEFKDAVKFLGGEVDALPVAKIAANERRKLTRSKLPPDHLEDAELSNRIISTCNKKGGYYVASGGNQYFPMITAEGETKNLACFERYDEQKENPCFVAGGPSYDCFYRIVKNERPEWLAVTSLRTGYIIARNYGLNVAVCFSGAVMKYICMWNYGELKIKPVLTAGNDDYLAYEMNYLYWDGEKLFKQKQK